MEDGKWFDWEKRLETHTPVEIINLIFFFLTKLRFFKQLDLLVRR